MIGIGISPFFGIKRGWPRPVLGFDIFNQDFSTEQNLDNFSVLQTGAVFSYVGGKLRVVTNALDDQDTIIAVDKTPVPQYSMFQVFKAQTVFTAAMSINANSYGILISRKSQIDNVNYDNDFYAYFDTRAATAGYCRVTTGTNSPFASSPNGFAISNTDRLRATFYANGNVLTALFENLTTSQSSTISLTASWVPTFDIFKAGYYSIRMQAQTGQPKTYDFEYFRVFSETTYKNPKNMFLGDSITCGYGADSMDNAFPKLVSEALEQTYTTWGTPGADCQGLYDSINEPLFINGQRAFLFVGANDLLNGNDPGYKAWHRSLVDNLEAAGIEVIILTPTPWTTLNTTSLKNWIQSEYGTTNTVIDVFTPLLGSGTSLNADYDCGDGIHPNELGQALISNIILSALQEGLYYDNDAFVFFYLKNIIDQTQKSATNTYVIGLKNAGLWPKAKALWPMIYNDNAKNAANLKQAAAFEIDWTVAPVSTPTGVRFNGSTQYGKTGFVPSSNSDSNDISFGAYFSEMINDVAVFFGAVNSGGQQLRLFPFVGSLAKIFSYIYDGSNGYLESAAADGLGDIHASKLPSGEHANYKDGTQINNNATSGGSRPNIELYIGASNSAGTPAQFYGGRALFASIFEGLTAAEELQRKQVTEEAVATVNAEAVAAPNVVFEGDSIMTVLYNLPQSVISNLSSNDILANTANNFAVSGAALSSIIGTNNYLNYSSRLAAVQAVFNPTCVNILTAFEGINELYYQLQYVLLAAAVPATYAAYEDYYIDNILANGFKAIINTLTPRGNVGTPADYETGRQQVNTLLRADFDVATDTPRVFLSSLSKWEGAVLIDVGDDPDFGQPGDENDLTYYNADKVHPTNLTSQMMADNYYGPAIQILIDNNN